MGSSRSESGHRGRAWRLVVVLALVALASTACRPSGPLEVSAVQVGRSLNSDNSVGNHTTSFRPDDTMHVAVLTTGAGSGTITVRWLFGTRLISEETREVSYRGSAATEFHIQNSGGLPEGSYTVEVAVDGEPFATRRLRVDR